MYKQLMMLMVGMFISACAYADLDRNQAGQMIAKNYPTSITKEFKLRQYVFGMNTILDQKTRYTDFTPTDKKAIDVFRFNLEAMRYAGFVEFTEQKIVRQVFSQRLGNIVFDITPTEKMNALIKKRDNEKVEVEVGRVEFAQVTGIIDASNTSKIAEFTTRPVFNDIAKFFKISEYERSEASNSAHFQKYDDGWRIKNPR